MKSRTPKLIGLAMYEINSIGTSKRARKKVLLAGKNKEKLLNLYFSKVITFKPIKTANDKVKVTKMWLVAVNVYGIKPIKLLKSIKLNITDMKGKYLVLSIVIMSEINWAVTSDKDSTTFCQEFGIK